MDSSLKEFFGGSTTVKIRFRGRNMEHVLKAPTNEQDLEYRRRAAKVSVKGRHVDATDQSLNAPLWLWEHVVEAVRVENDEGQMVEIGREDWALVPARVKLEAIAAMLTDIERDESETLRD